MLHYFRSSAAGTIRLHPAIAADLSRSKPILHNYVGV
jgi:hypothetical protein